MGALERVGDAAGGNDQDVPFADRDTSERTAEASVPATDAHDGGEPLQTRSEKSFDRRRSGGAGDVS